MIDLGRVSIETKGGFNGFYLDNPCEPESGRSRYQVQCP